MDPITQNGASEGELWGCGTSLPVPSVQELAKQDFHNVPESLELWTDSAITDGSFPCYGFFSSGFNFVAAISYLYIQQDQDRPLVVEPEELSQAAEEVPVIKFSSLVDGNEDEARKLDSACKEWGFFQIVDHGIDELLQRTKVMAAAFFDLPLEAKKKYAMAPNDLQGYGQAFVVSDEQKLDWSDIMLLLTVPERGKNMKYWPTEVSGFRETVNQYTKEMGNVSEVILTSLSLLLGMDKDGLMNHHGEIKHATRLNYYPPCSRPDLVVGLSSHSDSSSITLLLQDDDVVGLQLRHKGRWVPVKPIPNAIVVNLGDVMESWSNGLYRSIEHRAVTNKNAPRRSIATFLYPQDDVDIGPLETMVDEDRPRKYRSIKHIDYLMYTLSKKMSGKASNLEILRV